MINCTNCEKEAISYQPKSCCEECWVKDFDEAAADQFIQGIDYFLAQEQLINAVDLIFGVVDRLCLDRKFIEVGAIITKTPLTWPISILLSLLTITFWAKTKLSNRAEFFQGVAHKIRSENKDVEILIRGLE